MVPGSDRIVAEATPRSDFKRIELRYMLRFCSVGVLNTSLTLMIIAVLFRWFGVGLVAANAIGYLAGICFSFFMNRSWTFASRDRGLGASAIRFLIVTAVAYGSSLGTLSLMYSFAGAGAVWSQLASILTYTCLSFGGSRLFAFKPS